MNYNKQALINARAHDLASDGGFQHEVAEEGLQGIDSMSDEQLKSQLDYYDIDYQD